MSLTHAQRAPADPAPEVLELDVTDVAQAQAVADHVRGTLGGSTASSTRSASRPEDCLGGGFLDAPWSSVSTAFHVSSYSLRTLAAAFAPLMPETGGALVALTFDARIAWPLYDWMGPAKAALEVDRALSGARARPAQDPRQHHLRRTAGDDRRTLDPGIRSAEVVVGQASAARMGQRRQRSGRRRHRLSAQRPRARDHRRDDPRRRGVSLPGRAD